MVGWFSPWRLLFVSMPKAVAVPPSPFSARFAPSHLVRVALRTDSLDLHAFHITHAARRVKFPKWVGVCALVLLNSLAGQQGALGVVVVRLGDPPPYCVSEIRMISIPGGEGAEVGNPTFM